MIWKKVDGELVQLSDAEEAAAREDIAAGRALASSVSGRGLVLLSAEEEAATRAEWAQAEQAAAADAQAKQTEAARIDAIRQDPVCADLLERLRSFTPAQIDSYVDSNVTDPASTRALLKRMLMMLALLARSV